MSQFPPPQPDWQADIETETKAEGGGMAVASLVLGLVGLVAWCCPIVGLPINITGLILGIKSKNSPKRGMAIAGIVLCIIGLVLTIINGAIGAYMGATGQHPLLEGYNDGSTSP